MKPIAAAVLLFIALVAPAVGKGLTDAQIRDAMIRESIASYPGSCPCPYNTDQRGHSCGRRSAYSRPGGYAPLCYGSDVSDSMVTEYRKTHQH